jgi:hypothetical protein
MSSNHISNKDLFPGLLNLKPIEAPVSSLKLSII